jgi:hypothetical protein
MRTSPLGNLQAMKTECPNKDVMRERSSEVCSELGRRSAKSRRHRKDYGWTKPVDTFDFAHIEPLPRPVTAIAQPPAEGQRGRQPEAPDHRSTSKTMGRIGSGWSGKTSAPAAPRWGFPGTEIGDEDDPAVEFWDSDGAPDFSGCEILKHGFPDGGNGEVRIGLQLVDGGPQVRLRMSNTGVGLPADFESK